MNSSSPTKPPNYRWNFIAFVTDYVFFGTAYSFINPNSVLPAFIRQLTASAPVIGMVTTIYNGCWLLPQLIVARAINDKPRKKPYLMLGLSGRAVFWLVALALWLGLSRTPTVMLIVFFACLGIFATSDGLASVAWFDMLARSIPVERRGRLLGMAQVIGGLTGAGAGALVGLILDHPTLAFPVDYTLIFALAGLTFIPSTIALALLREPPIEQDEDDEKQRRKSGWFSPLLEDPIFRRLLSCRILTGMITLATPFYVTHATDVLHLSERIVGSFVAAQTLTGMAAGFILGWISERWGPRHVVRIGSAFATIGPLFAMLIYLTDGSGLARFYPVVYVALGVVNNANMLGFYNYLLEIAPDEVRPSYIGLSNTIMGALALAPTVGGGLLEATSYGTLFGITAALVAISFLLAMGLKAPASSA